jgi:tetratricopeptide (TPR) repeat protein
VIHRDLKPANVALGEYGEAVVLDWGLAKLREGPDLSEPRWRERIEALRRERDLRTLTSALGTPGYMSPEAALGQMGEVDEQSDVYSLGAVLCKALAGRLPYRFGSYAELAQKLLDEEPDPLGAEVPEGLAAICGKALARLKWKRFRSVGELAAAVRAWQTESAVEREVASLLKEAEGAWGEELSQLERVAAACDRILKLRPGHAAARALFARCHEARDGAIARREAVARRRVLKRAAVAGLAVATVATVVVALLLDAKRRETEEARSREAVARQKAQKERERADELAGFMLFNLRDALQPIGRLNLLGMVAEKSLEYYENLPEEGETPEVLRGRSVALNNVGGVLHARGDLEAALRSYRASLAIMARLTAEEPRNAAWQRDLAICLERTGNALLAKGDVDEAARSHKDSLAIRERLAADDPSDPELQRDVAISHDRLGWVLEAKGDVDGALESYRADLAIVERLARDDPSNPGRQRDLAVTYEKMGILLLEKGDVDGGLGAQRDCLAIRERLSELDPSNAVLERDLAISHNGVGDLLRAKGDLEGALRSFGQSLSIEKRLCAQDPSNADWQHDLSFTHSKVGVLLQAKGDLEGALKSSRDSLSIEERLCTLDPSNGAWQRDLSVAHERVGGVLQAKGDWEGAQKSYRELLSIMERLCAQDPSNAGWQHDLSLGLERVGDVLQTKGDLDGALKSYRDCLAIRERLHTRDPSNTRWERGLSVAHEKVGDVLIGKGDPDGALESYRADLAISERLSAKDQANAGWQRDLSVALDKVGNALLAKGDLDGALERYRTDLAISERLSAKDPSNADWQRDLAVTRYRIAAVLLAGHSFKDAAAEARSAEEAHARAVKLAPHMRAEHGMWIEQLDGTSLLAGEREPASARDHLALGHALHEAKEYVRSAEQYATALEDRWVRADLDGGSLYKAACAAAMASAVLKGREAAEWRSKALVWLAEDLDRRRKLLEAFEALPGRDLVPGLRTRLENGRGAFLAHLEDARVKVRDLASLRGSAEFEALFERGGK